ncbi:MAG: hypothetical protein ACRDRW_09295 [Pseudonocardiaceae bacterium]
MNNDAGAHRSWRRRAMTMIGLEVATVVALAAPALAHPVFSNDAPGFPNPQGSTANPYPVGSRPTMNMFLPFEQEGVIVNGAANTTVDVQVTVPAGWASPACGAVRTSSSVGYRQLGTVVPGWTCAIEPVSGHQVLHWSGPQISPSQTFADSAQFFTFQVTVPSPATQTSYGATGGPEGFTVEQVYANRVTSLWRTPNSTRPGEVANGIVRTVAGTTAPPSNQSVGPAPPETHAGPTPPGPNPPGVKPPGAKPTTALPPNPVGGGPSPTPAGQPSPTGTPTAAGPSEGAPPASPASTSTEPPPGAQAPSSSTKQRAQQRDEATGQGVRWRIVVGIVVSAALVVGAVIAVVKRRRRPS